VKYKPSAWQLIFAVAALCGLAVWGVAVYRSRNLTASALMRRMPPGENALVLYVDFAALRQAGVLQLLDGSKVAEEPDYQAFVRKTDFDYRQDLDSALVAFAPSGKYLLLKGRFDWRSLRSYVESQEGRCYNSFCQMEGSAPERHISFFPLQPNLMAMAVSPDNSAALRLQSVGAPVPDTPRAAVWLSIPPSALKARDDLPGGTRMFARSIEAAQNATLTLAPEGPRLAARLDVRCRNEQDAAAAAAALTSATSTLREAIEREHQKPNPADFSGVLTAGAFRSDGRRVYGFWPIERAFISNVLGGGN
jgi:hypothetical protein